MATSVGSLTREAHVWCAYCKNQWINRVVRGGYRIPWPEIPPLSEVPLAFPNTLDPARIQIIEEEVQSLVMKGAVTLVQVTPGFYSRIFTVPKKTGGYRPVLDLSALNNYIRPIHFQMETTAKIRLAIN